ncbi:MAG: hypothetical protein ACK56I_26515, partial [bacterium]
LHDGEGLRGGGDRLVGGGQLFGGEVAAVLGAGQLHLQLGQALVVQGHLGALLAAVDHRQRRPQVLQRRLQLLPAAGLAGLDAQAADAARPLFEQVGDAREVLV